MLSDSDSEWGPSSDGEYAQRPLVHRRKRRKVAHDDPYARTIYEGRFSAILVSTLEEYVEYADEEDLSFEKFMEPMLTEYAQSVLAFQRQHELRNDEGIHLILMSRLQAKQMLDELTESGGATLPENHNHVTSLLRRKLKLYSNKLRTAVLNPNFLSATPNRPLTPLEKLKQNPPPNPEVLDALYFIQTTPYSNSFLSRIQGYHPHQNPGLVDVDWETRAPWMDLLWDIREHYKFMHPERELPEEVEAPIEYAPLRADHLLAVHHLLRNVFWDGIDVSDSLQYSPEKCTIIATYKKLIVGCAFLSSPQETYITYLAVRPGWEGAQIATKMLYRLITMNPHRDILLHVSISNPAMLLYNRFGFKAEEFIVGFYEDYLDSKSRASKNAFRLRLRR